MINSSDITIVIPAYNESGAISKVVTALKQELPEAEILVIDDGSTDETAIIAKNAGATVISHENKSGYGSSLATGFRKSTREYLLFCDADGQHRAEDAKRLVTEGDSYDLVIGARTSDSHAPLFRRPGKWVLRKFANMLAGQKIPDLNSGLRLVKRDLLAKYIHLMPKGFSFSTTTTFSFMKSGRKIKYVPITVQKRTGTSTVRQWKHGPSTILLMVRLTVLFEPLKVFMTLAAALFVLGLGSTALDIWLAGQLNIGETTVMLFLASLQVFLAGLFCDQVSAIRREIHE